MKNQCIANIKTYVRKHTIVFEKGQTNRKTLISNDDRGYPELSINTNISLLLIRYYKIIGKGVKYIR